MACDSPFYVLPKAGTEKVPVPCGRCPPCKQRRVESWVFRLLQEEKQHTSAVFITLTYDTQHVPISPNGFMTLQKSDYQLFMKRLRKANPTWTLKYYACGEYGSQTKRPHYHAIIFGVEDSAAIHDAWGLGTTHVGSVSDKSIAYTMKYIDKAKRKKEHERDDRLPEFALMSKGLGANYVQDEQIQRYHQADLSRLYVTREGGHKVAMPRYYRSKLYTEQQQKQQTQLAAEQQQQKEQQLWETYRTLGYDPEHYSFQQWKENQKFGRYANFYNSQKKRL